MNTFLSGKHFVEGRGSPGIDVSSWRADPWPGHRVAGGQCVHQEHHNLCSLCECSCTYCQLMQLINRQVYTNCIRS